MATTYISTGETKGTRIKTNAARVFSYIFLVFVALLSLFPFYLLIINSTRSNAELQSGFSLIPHANFVNNFVTAWNDTNLFTFPRSLFNSFFVAAVASLLTTYFSAMTAYGIQVYNFKGRNVMFKFILIIMMIPTQISAAGFLQLVDKFNMRDTYWPLLIPAIAAPSVFFYMKQYMESSMPMEVIEAARVDGSNEFRTFNTIAVPMLKPAISVQLIFAFVASWNNYFTPALVLDSSKNWTLPIALAAVRARINSEAGDMGEGYMFIFLSIIPVVLVYIFISRNIVEGVALGAVKG